MKKSTLQQQTKDILLDANGIDQISELTYSALSEAGADPKDSIRLRLSVEDILDLWMKRLSPQSTCRFTCGTRFGKQFIHIRTKGEKADPNVDYASDESADYGEYLYSGLLAQAGLSLTYSYKDGENILSVYPPRKRKSNPVLSILFSILAAVLFGIISGYFPGSIQSAVTMITEPLFNTLLGALRAIASPMIFLAVCWGIVSIGDIRVLGKIGRVVLTRSVIFIYVILGLTAAGTFWMFHTPKGDASGGSDSAFSQIYAMLLDIIPKDIFSPFLSGNATQIIFLGICVGIAILILGEKASSVMKIVEQLNDVVGLLMSGFGRLIPLFVFLSIYSLMSSDSLALLGGIFKGIVVIVVCCLLWPLGYVLVMSLRLKVSFPRMIRKLLPTFLIGLTTASSAAALTTNLDTCQNKLGIPGKITNFAVPLGQVIFMPAAAGAFMLMGICMAENFGVPVSPSWILTNIIVSGLLAMAAPPIPGGSLSCFTILFTQLGLPAESITLAISASILLEFLLTAGNLACLQAELTLAANKLGMLDRNILRNE